jgi:hypothetical protein
LFDKNDQRRHHPMRTKEDIAPYYPLPVFLSERADEPVRPRIGIAWDSAVISSRILKTSILVVTATAIAILWVGNPAALLADVTASLVDISTFQGHSTPTIQSPGAQPSPPTAKDARTVNLGVTPESAPSSVDKTVAMDAAARDEIVAAFKPSDQSQTEVSESSEALFKQFQAWAVEKDARPLIGPVKSVPDGEERVVQNAPAQVAENARVPVRPTQEHQHFRRVQNARAEIQPERHARAKVRREQNARVKVRPLQDTRAEEPPVPQAPSLLQSIGLQN